MPIDIHLKDTLEKLDEKYGGDELFRLFGPSSLSWASTDSSRNYMFSQHIKQALALLEPEVPRLQTGMENSIGKYNHAYKQLKGNWEVKKIIPKFSFPEDTKDQMKLQIFMVVLYNKKTDTYEMLEKPVAENLTEKFGYIYNASFLESLHEGDKLTDPVLYKSTSYDDHMNYRYGKNARVMYSTSTDTIEDAVVIRRGWADQVKSVEVDVIQVPLNDNDVMLNVYGTDEEYKAFPDIGEHVRDALICATRRINKTHLLYDFQKAHMREIMDTDTDYYASKHSMIYDINVFYNGDDEFPNNKFYRQLRKYYLDNCQYAQKILEACNEIKYSGSHYTQNVSYYRSKYLRYNDKEYKWKNKDKAFGHIVLEFKVKSIVDLDLGSKITGRWGNKGVVSRVANDTTANLESAIIDMVDDGTMTEEEKLILRSKLTIVEDERMPYYIRNGEKIYVDALFNSSGAIRRLNPGQLVETEINFCAEQVQQMIINAKTDEEKEKIFFRFLDIINLDQCTFFQKLYYSYDETKMVNGVNIRFMAPEYKKAFIQDVEKNGFYLVRPPHKPLLLDDVIRVYEAFPEIKPVDIYIDIFGMERRKTLKPGVVGYQYMLILKQNSNKNFSARSTFRVNRSNLPAKDIAKKTNRSSYARTPVRLSEIYNLLASINGVDLAEHNIFMRSSALGRKSLDRILATDGNPLKIKKLKVQDNFTNSNADILAAKLKTLGLRIYYSPVPEGRVMIYDNNTVCPLHFGDYVIYDYPRNRVMYKDLFELFEKKMNEKIVIESYHGEKHDMCWDAVFDDADLKAKYTLTDELKEQLRVTTKGQLSSLMSQLNKKNSRRSSSSDPSNPGPKKRGRKSKAEKAEMERQQEREMHPQPIEEDSEEEELPATEESEEVDEIDSLILDEE